MTSRWRIWSLIHLAILGVGVGLGGALDSSLLPWWLGVVIPTAVFSLQMTRQALTNDPDLPPLIADRWVRRLLWLGPVGVVWLLCVGAQATGPLP